MKPLPILVAFCLLSSLAFAHQPRLVYGATEANPFIVTDPEISRVYYGELGGQSEYYKITSDKPFNLSFTLLIPDAGGVEKYGMNIYVSDDNRMQLFLFEPTPFEWTPYYDEFGNNWYLEGPSANKQLPAGTYWIRIYSGNNSGKYALSLGTNEEFPVQEAVGALFLMPLIKQQFFGKEILIPAIHQIGIALILASMLSLALSAYWSRKSKENNKAIIGAFLAVRKLAWAGIIVFAASGALLYQAHPPVILLLSELAIGILLILFWAWISFDAASKFSKIADKKVLIADKYIKSLSWKLAVSAVLWIFVLVLSSAI